MVPSTIYIQNSGMTYTKTFPLKQKLYMLKTRIRPMQEIRDTQLQVFFENVEFFMAKLRRFTTGVTAEEMAWKPTGINNPLAWIVRHCADLLWLSYGRISGTRVPVNFRASGIAWGSVKDAAFDERAPGPGQSAEELIEYLESAWQTLRDYVVQNYPAWEEVKLLVEQRRQSAWMFLYHNVGDFCYHTGQASYLRKLLAAERRRTKSKH
jgi:hypothetical protein